MSADLIARLRRPPDWSTPAIDALLLEAAAALARLEAERERLSVELDKERLVNDNLFAGSRGRALAKALKFYADSDAYRPEPRRVRPVIEDGGAIARAALGEQE